MSVAPLVWSDWGPRVLVRCDHVEIYAIGELGAVLVRDKSPQGAESLLREESEYSLPRRYEGGSVPCLGEAIPSGPSDMDFWLMVPGEQDSARVGLGYWSEVAPDLSNPGVPRASSDLGPGQPRTDAIPRRQDGSALLQRFDEAG
jgi:hypothetical protein